MTAYLKLSDAEWEAIRPCLPPQRSGPRRKHERETVTAFLFAQAAGVSLDSPSRLWIPQRIELAHHVAKMTRERRTGRGDGGRFAGGGADGAAISATDHRPVAAAAAAEGDRQAFGDDAALCM